MLRQYTPDIPLKFKTVPIIVFDGDKVLEAQSKNEKIKLLFSLKGTETIVAVWPGAWSSDTFVLKKDEALKILTEVK